MHVTRVGTTRRWSDAVIFNNTIYLVEVPTNLEDDITAQSKNVLSAVSATLEKVGSNKKNILMTTIYLKDITEIDKFNEVWDEWLPEGCAPSRACVGVRLANPLYRVELQVVAAINKSQ